MELKLPKMHHILATWLFVANDEQLTKLRGRTCDHVFVFTVGPYDAGPGRRGCVWVKCSIYLLTILSSTLTV